MGGSGLILSNLTPAALAVMISVMSYGRTIPFEYKTY